MSIVNGMIGVNCLVLPTMGLSAGYLNIIWTCALMGFVCYYMAVLLVTHMGKANNIKESILGHFNGDYRFMAGYSVINYLAFIPAIFQIFRIVCLQIEGLIGYHSVWVGLTVSLLLVTLIIVIRVTHFAEESMVLGVLSIVTILVFIGWALVTAPAGTRSVPASGNAFNMAAVFIVAFSIHDYITQCIVKNPNKDEYQGIIKKSFGIGFFINLFATLGCFAIVNRPSYVPHPQILSDYFPPQQWQTIVTELVYLVSALSLLPGFIIVSKYPIF